MLETSRAMQTCVMALLLVPGCRASEPIVARSNAPRPTDATTEAKESPTAPAAPKPPTLQAPQTHMFRSFEVRLPAHMKVVEDQSMLTATETNVTRCGPMTVELTVARGLGKDRRTVHQSGMRCQTRRYMRTQEGARLICEVHGEWELGPPTRTTCDDILDSLRPSGLVGISQTAPSKRVRPRPTAKARVSKTLEYCQPDDGEWWPLVEPPRDVDLDGIPPKERMYVLAQEGPEVWVHIHKNAADGEWRVVFSEILTGLTQAKKGKRGAGVDLYVESSERGSASPPDCVRHASVLGGGEYDITHDPCPKTGRLRLYPAP